MWNSRPKTLALALCMSLATLAGCQGPNLQDRMDDTAEIVRLNGGLGPGLLANVHVTRLLAVGVGAYEARRYGFRNGYGWIWDERRYDANLGIPIWGWEDVDAVVHGGMPKSLLRGDERDVCWWAPPLTIADKNRGWLEVSANLHLIWLGLDVGVDCGELLDCICGWFGFDPAGDDAWTGKDVAKHEPGPTPPAGRPGTEILK